MPVTKFKRGSTWYLRGTIRGRSIYETTGTHSEREAEAIRIQREQELLHESVYGPKAQRTFEEAVESYLESGGSPRFLGGIGDDGKPYGLLGRFFGVKLRTIAQEDLDRAASELYPDTMPETRNRQFYTPFVAVWNHAVANGWADTHQWRRPRKLKGTGVKRLKPYRSGTKPVAYERAAQFVAAMSPAPAFLLTAAFYTGMRPIELFTLQAGDVDIDARWLVVRSSKTGEPRGVPIHSFLLPLMSALKSRGGTMFLTHKRKPYPVEEEGSSKIKRAIEGARERTGIRDVSPYTGRHSVSTQLVINGVHPHIKDQILGHAADDMSRHYTNVPQAPLIEAIETLPVPDLWRRMPWYESPLDWQGKLYVPRIWNAALGTAGEPGNQSKAG